MSQTFDYSVELKLLNPSSLDIFLYEIMLKIPFLTKALGLTDDVDFDRFLYSHGVLGSSTEKRFSWLLLWHVQHHWFESNSIPELTHKIISHR